MKYISIIVSCIICFYASSQNLTTNDYTKEEVRIPMRDDIQLFTTIYRPKNDTKKYPVLIKRTTYSVAPYGADTMPETIMHNPNLVAAGYIFVHQDVRGRWMSEGEFENCKPPYSFKDKQRTDEVTDSYDTFDWLIKNLKNFNGNIGQYGNSYLGYTSLVSSVTGHPNLKAVLAMAPVTNFFFEDFNRYGLYGMNYMPVMDVFGIQKTEPTTESWYNVTDKSFVHDVEKWITEDYYAYFLKHKALSDVSHLIDSNNFFWKNIISHPNYDDYRKERDWIQHLDQSKCPTMIVGGLNDEQNLYGIINSYKKIAEDNPSLDAKLVLGPWSHGHPKRRDSLYYLGDIYYGAHLSKNYQEEIEFNYFEYHLKGKGALLNFDARVFDTGAKEWTNFNDNPFKTATETIEFYLNPIGFLDDSPSSTGKIYTSDPNSPVPYVNDDNFYMMAPKSYMTDDQRFVTKRPDVLSYISEPLTDDLTVMGEIKAMIQFATDHSDADIYVKIIDVFPMDRIPEPTDLPNVKLNGFQHLVRCGYIRGRYRKDYSTPIPFEANKKELIDVPLLEIYHTFKKGHRIMVQIQSSMFPLFDMNPQNYVENIYDAIESDFRAAQHTVFGDSRIVLPIISK